MNAVTALAGGVLRPLAMSGVRRDETAAGRADADFDVLYGPQARRVLQTCRYLLGPDEAEDAAHEVFLRARQRFWQYNRGERRCWRVAVRYRPGHHRAGLRGWGAARVRAVLARSRRRDRSGQHCQLHADADHGWRGRTGCAGRCIPRGARRRGPAERHGAGRSNQRGFFLGRTILGPRDPGGPAPALLVGLLAVFVAVNLPFVGWIINLALTLVGVGVLFAWAMSTYRGRTEPAGI